MSVLAGCIVLIQRLKWQMFIRQSTTHSLFSAFVHSDRKHTPIWLESLFLPCQHICTSPSVFSLSVTLSAINVLSCIAQDGLGQPRGNHNIICLIRSMTCNSGFRQYATLEVLHWCPVARFWWKTFAGVRCCQRIVLYFYFTNNRRHQQHELRSRS